MADMRRHCGNSPHAELIDGDRQAAGAFRAYLAKQKAAAQRQDEWLAEVVKRAQGASPEQLRELIALTIRADLQKAIPPRQPVPGGPVLGPGMGRTEYDLADTAMAVVQPEVERLRAERDRYRAAWHSARHRAAERSADLHVMAEEIDRLTTEIAEGIGAQTMLKGLNMRDGQVHLEIEPAREMVLVLVASMRAMLDEAGAENYLTTEATFPPAVHLDLQDGKHPEDSYTLTVQRRHRPTAHDLRRRAETERDEALTKLSRLDAVQAVYEQWEDHCLHPQAFEFLKAIRGALRDEKPACPGCPYFTAPGCACDNEGRDEPVDNPLPIA